MNEDDWVRVVEREDPPVEDRGGRCAKCGTELHVEWFKGAMSCADCAGASR